MTIHLTPELTAQLEAQIQDSAEFSSVEAYVNYVLGEVLKQTGAAQPEAYTKDEEEEVKKRLEDLGYLD